MIIDSKFVNISRFNTEIHKRIMLVANIENLCNSQNNSHNKKNRDHLNKCRKLVTSFSVLIHYKNFTKLG